MALRKGCLRKMNVITHGTDQLLSDVVVLEVVLKHPLFDQQINNQTGLSSGLCTQQAPVVCFLINELKSNEVDKGAVKCISR